MMNGWLVPGTHERVVNWLYTQPYALSRRAGDEKQPYTLGSKIENYGQIVAMGFEGPVFVISVRQDW